MKTKKIKTGIALQATSYKLQARGFTLVEMIVALGLFTAVILIGLGALANMVAGAQKTKSIGIVMDNLNFALESMTRSMRVGTNYHCGSGGDLSLPASCVSGGDQISFRDSSGRLVVYRMRVSSIERSIDGGITFLGVTAPEIKIGTLQFYVGGAMPGDLRQPVVLILIRGVAGGGGTSSAFNIQTLVTQRFFDS